MWHSPAFHSRGSAEWFWGKPRAVSCTAFLRMSPVLNSDFACFFDRKMFSSASWATSDACGRMAEKYFNRAWLGTVHQAEQGQVLQKSRGCVKRN